MNISKQVGNQAHLLVIEQSSKKLSLTYCREKIVMAISEMAITIILLLTDKVQKVLTQKPFRE